MGKTRALKTESGRATRARSAEPLDAQVSEIQGLIHRLRKRERAPVLERAMTTLQRSRTPRTPTPRSPTPPPTFRAGAGSQTRLRAVTPSGDVSAHLLEVCKRLEAAVARIESVSGGAATSSAKPSALGPDCLLRGRLTDSLLPDVLQMLTSNHWTGVFVLSDGKDEHRLYFDDGEACHAEGPKEKGEAAFIAALATEEGEYYFEKQAAHAQKTIKSNTQFLILEALRQADEAKGG